MFVSACVVTNNQSTFVPIQPQRIIHHVGKDTPLRDCTICAALLGCCRRTVVHTAPAATRLPRQAGFVESFNISVAAALILYEAQQQRLRRLGTQGDLSGEQQQRLLAEFLLRSVVRAGRRPQYKELQGIPLTVAMQHIAQSHCYMTALTACRC